MMTMPPSPPIVTSLLAQLGPEAAPGAPAPAPPPPAGPGGVAQRAAEAAQRAAEAADAAARLAQGGAASGETGGAAAPEVGFEDAAGIVWDSVVDIGRGFLAHLPQVAAGLVVLILTAVAASLLSRLLRRMLGPARFRASLKDLFRQLIYIAIWIAGLMVAAVVVFPGFTPAKALGVLGLGSLAVGFAFKDIFENFLAGIFILWRFPFDPGDYIECKEITGRVEEITIRNTLIRQVDGQLVVIPNADLFKNPVSVLTSLKARRTTVICGVAYGEDVDVSRGVIQRAVEACGTVVRGPGRPIQIFAQEFADSSINFEVTWWTGATPVDIRRSKDEVVAAVKRALDDAGIEIPFPYRTLTFKEDYPMHVARGGADGGTEP